MHTSIMNYATNEIQIFIYHYTQGPPGVSYMFSVVIVVGFLLTIAAGIVLLMIQLQFSLSRCLSLDCFYGSIL